MADIEIQVISAHNLISADIGGKSDPYVVVSYDDGPQLARTTSKSNDQNPTWKEWLTISAPPPGAKDIRFSVWDDDLDADDCMGMMEIPVNHMDGHHSISLIPIPGHKSYKSLSKRGNLGTLSVAIKGQAPMGTLGDATVQYSPSPAKGSDTVEYHASSTGHSTPTMTMVGATGLMDTDAVGMADPFVKVFRKGTDTSEKAMPMFQTRPINGTTHPTWNESHKFHWEQGDEHGFIAQVWDKDTIGGDFMGECVIMPENGDRSYKLKPREGNDSDQKKYEKKSYDFGHLMVKFADCPVRERSMPDEHISPIALPPPVHQDNMDINDVIYGMEAQHRDAPTTTYDEREEEGAGDGGYVSMKLVRGSGLAPMDRAKGNPTSDPFVKVFLEGSDGDSSVLFISEVVKKNTNPFWDQHFEVTVPQYLPPNPRLKFAVYDEDLKKEDDFMGEAYLPISHEMRGSHQLKLCPRPGNADDLKVQQRNKGLGFIVVEVDDFHFPHLPKQRMSDFQSVHVEVVRAYGLRSNKWDPYVTAGFGRLAPVARTAIKANTDHPVWKEYFLLEVPHDEVMLKFAVVDYDQKSSDDLIGNGLICLKGNINGTHQLVLGKGYDSETLQHGKLEVKLWGVGVGEEDSFNGFMDEKSATHISESGTKTRGATIVGEYDDLTEEERTAAMAKAWRSYMGKPEPKPEPVKKEKIASPTTRIDYMIRHNGEAPPGSGTHTSDTKHFTPITKKPPTKHSGYIPGEDSHVSHDQHMHSHEQTKSFKKETIVTKNALERLDAADGKIDGKYFGESITRRSQHHAVYYDKYDRVSVRLGQRTAHSGSHAHSSSYSVSSRSGRGVAPPYYGYSGPHKKTYSVGTPSKYSTTSKTSSKPWVSPAKSASGASISSSRGGYAWAKSSYCQTDFYDTRDKRTIQHSKKQGAQFGQLSHDRFAGKYTQESYDEDGYLLPDPVTPLSMRDPIY